MTNEEMILAFRRLNEEVEQLRKSVAEKDRIINEQNLTIMRLSQELSKRNGNAIEKSEEQVSEARKAFL